MYTKEIGDLICEQLAQGKSLRGICAEQGMPAHSTVLEWAREIESFANQYARAREIGDDVEFESLADLADEQPPLTPAGAVDNGWVQWQKNRIDTRKWGLARKRPRKYGDKLDIAHSGGVTVAISPLDERL